MSWPCSQKVRSLLSCSEPCHNLEPSLNHPSQCPKGSVIAKLWPTSTSAGARSLRSSQGVRRPWFFSHSRILREPSFYIDYLLFRFWAYPMSEGKKIISFLILNLVFTLNHPWTTLICVYFCHNIRRARWLQSSDQPRRQRVLGA